MKQIQKSGREETAPTSQEMQTTSELPLIVSLRTGLAGKDDAIVDRPPTNYIGKSVGDVIEHITSKEGLTPDEKGLAESVKRELRSRESVVVVNGKKANLSDKAEKYAVIKEHVLPGGIKKQYRELEIEISAVQQGGLYSLL